MKFRTKPVVKEAIQFIADDSVESVNRMFAAWPEFKHACLSPQPNGALSIGTLEGVMIADYGDWIIKGVKGEFYPVKDEIFQLTYEPVTEE